MALSRSEIERNYRQRKAAGIKLHKPSLRERFESKVDKSAPGGCWRWTASFLTTGYGQININKKPEGAHRVSYRLYCAPIPDGKDVCHSCDNRWCVNPDHLWLGTRRDNLRDAAEKGRMPGRSAPGELHAMAKLAEADVLEIRASQERGVDLARRYGVSPQAICNIRKRKVWKHI